MYSSRNTLYSLTQPALGTSRPTTGRSQDVLSLATQIPLSFQTIEGGIRELIAEGNRLSTRLLDAYELSQKSNLSSAERLKGLSDVCHNVVFSYEKPHHFLDLCKTSLGLTECRWDGTGCCRWSVLNINVSELQRLTASS